MDLCPDYEGHEDFKTYHCTYCDHLVGDDGETAGKLRASRVSLRCEKGHFLVVEFVTREGHEWQECRTNEAAVFDLCMRKWGYDSQRLIWIEEMAELIQSLAKSDRAINPSCTSEILDEIADVDICLAQIKHVYPQWEDYRDRKMGRLKRILEVD